jgi:hypothetical protein
MAERPRLPEPQGHYMQQKGETVLEVHHAENSMLWSFGYTDKLECANAHICELWRVTDLDIMRPAYKSKFVLTRTWAWLGISMNLWRAHPFSLPYDTKEP